MPSYAWRCHVCESANAPSLSACAQCGFPAIASGRAIASARMQRQVAPDAGAQSQRQARFSLASLSELLAPLPPSKKVFALVGLGALALGVLIFKLMWSLKGALVGLVLAGVGIILLSATLASSPKASRK